MGYYAGIGLFRFLSRSLHKSKLHPKEWAGLTFFIKSKPEKHIVYSKKRKF